jgi:hypothetical protein
MSTNSIWKILESGNFWTAISGLGGVILGGFITYILQKKAEQRKIREERKALISKYSSFVDRVYYLAKKIDDNYLSNKINDSIRHINIPYMHCIFPEVDIKDPVVELYFLSETHDVKIIGKIYNYKNSYILLSDMINMRNELHTNQMVEILSKQPGTGSGYATLNQMESILGKPLFHKMKSATDSIYDNAKYIISNYNELKLRLTSIFKYLYPNAKMLEYFVED